MLHSQILLVRHTSLKIIEAVNEDEAQAIELLSGIRNLVYSHNDRGLRTEKVLTCASYFVKNNSNSR